MPGVPLQDLWTDIRPIGSRTAERLGYPTQKPEALLERILQASSNEGDLILDCFCGCGTTIAAAERLKRRWIGIDITHLAISLIRHRLRHSHGDPIEETYTVVGEPVELPDAITLARDDPFQSDREGVKDPSGPLTTSTQSSIKSRPMSAISPWGRRFAPIADRVSTSRKPVILILPA